MFLNIAADFMWLALLAGLLAAGVDARSVHRRIERQADIFGSDVRPMASDFGVLPVGSNAKATPSNSNPLTQGNPLVPSDGLMKINEIQGAPPPGPQARPITQNGLPPQPALREPAPQPNIPMYATGGGLPNPYDPYGKFKGGFGVGTSRGSTGLGTGYRIPEYYGFDWPNNGLQVQKGVDVPILGSNVARYDESNLYVRPDGSVAQYAFGDNQGLTVLGTGYKDGWQGNAGINGYDFGDRFTVPVLGTNVVDVNDRSGFDLAKMKFDTEKEHQYGPIGFTTGGTQFESPWLGQLVQRGMWNGALEEAGYETDSALPPGNIPGVPIVG